MEPPCEKILFFKTGHGSDLGMHIMGKNVDFLGAHQPLGVRTRSSVYGLKSRVFVIRTEVHCSVHKDKKREERGKEKWLERRRLGADPSPWFSLLSVRVDAGPLRSFVQGAGLAWWSFSP